MGRKRKGNPVHGWLALDKPIGMTSTQAMAKVRWLLKAEKAGHGGTLDPLATGILPIAFGEATKTVAYAMDCDKTYRFRVRWGESRDTDDSEGRVTSTSDVRPTEAAIRSALPAFLGDLDQVPPAYSAIKIDGERAYDLARSGEEVVLQSRLVWIERFELLGCPDADHADFEVECGKGTYVRSLARDLAVRLGTLGHVTELRRLNVGEFTLDNAVTLEQLEAWGPEEATNHLLPIETALDGIPALDLTADEARRLRSGQPIVFVSRHDLERLNTLDLDPEDESATVLAISNGKPVALTSLNGPELRPVRVLNV